MAKINDLGILLVPKSYSITTKFNLLSIILVLLTAVALSSYEIKRNKENHLEALLEHGQEVSSIIAKFSELALTSGNDDILNNIIAHADDEETTYIGLLRQDRTAIVERGKLPNQQYLSNEQLNNLEINHIAQYTLGGEYIQFLVPVISTKSPKLDGFLIDKANKDENQAYLGYVRLIFNTNQMRVKINESIKVTVLMTILIVVIAIALTLLLSRIV